MLSSWSLRNRVRFLTAIALTSFIALAAIVFAAFQVTQREQTLAMDNAQLAYAAKKARSELLDTNNSGRTFFYTGNAQEFATFNARIDHLVNSLRILRSDDPEGPAGQVLSDFYRYQNETHAMLDYRIQLGMTQDLGIEGEMRRYAKTAETLLRENEALRPYYALLIIRRFEKDFMLRRDPADLAAHEAQRERLGGYVKDADLPEGIEAEVIDLLSDYQRAFDDWVDRSGNMLIRSDASRKIFAAMLDELSDYANAKDAARAAADARLQDKVSQTVMVAGATMVGFILLSLFFTRKVGDSIANPIASISKDMLAMCEGRTQADKTFRHKGGNEIEALQAIMVFFRESLAESEMLHREIRYHRDHLKAEVARRTMELEQQTIRLEQSLSYEKEVNALQNQIVSTVSHEFRTPLAIIDGAARRVSKKADGLTPDETRDRMDNIRKAVQRLSNLVERTLDSSKMASGQMEFNLGEVNIAALVQDVVDRHCEFAPEFTFDVDTQSAPAVMSGDQRLLDHVAANLISNAIKYSKQRPHVIVTVATDEADVRISVKDHGVGIPKSELGQISKRFFRASTSSGIPGTGIGLNLVSQVVTMHGGAMTIDSEECEWTEFTVRLPIEGPSQEEEQMVWLDDDANAA